MPTGHKPRRPPHARGQRNQTTTEKNYYIGVRYLREKRSHGGDRKSEEIKGKKVAFDCTADRIAAEVNRSHQHVKNCAKFAAHLNEDAPTNAAAPRTARRPPRGGIARPERAWAILCYREPARE